MNGILSIIIPVYNTEHYLDKALKSIVNQTYQNLEIIIIDDGSTDRSSDIFLSYASQDSRIRIYKEPNSGVAYARNLGLSLSTGDYITFFDSDDWIDTDAYEHMIQLLEDTNSDIVMCSYVDEAEGVDYVKPNQTTSKAELKTSPEVLKKMLLNKHGGVIWNKIFKRNVIFDNKIKFINQLYILEDFYFLVQICKTNPQFVCTTKTLYHYFRRNGSITRSAVDDKKLSMNLGSEMILNDILDHYPELTSQAAMFFYNINVGLLNEVYHSKPINLLYKSVIKSSIKSAGLMKHVNTRTKLKVMLITCFPRIFNIFKWYNARQGQIAEHDVL